MTVALVIHGGADPRHPEAYAEPAREAQRLALRHALRVGHGILKGGGAALDAVEAAVMSLEDSGQFDAGRGAYRAADGGFDLDASIMDGRTGQAGAVAHVHHVRNPIRLARRVMERTNHVLLVAEGAEHFARDEALEFVTDDYFAPSMPAASKVHEPSQPVGTVGAVALDSSGNLAAGTSTGGIFERRAGRVGDTPIIGAGTYADNRIGAISGTGQGEYFLRAVLAHDIAARVEHGGASLTDAAHAALREKLTARGGSGGIIALDPRGQPVFVFNTPTMARGVVCGMDGSLRVALFGEQPA